MNDSEQMGRFKTIENLTNKSDASNILRPSRSSAAAAHRQRLFGFSKFAFKPLALIN